MKVSALSRARTELTLLRKRIEDATMDRDGLCEMIAERDRHIEMLEKRIYGYEKEAVDNFSRINRLEREVKIHMDTIECTLRLAKMTYPATIGTVPPAGPKPFPDSPKTREQTKAKIDRMLDPSVPAEWKDAVAQGRVTEGIGRWVPVPMDVSKG